MAYKLELPPPSHLHPVLPVSCLKKIIGNKILVLTILPEIHEEGKLMVEPEVVLDTRINQLQNHAITRYFIK